MVQLIDWVHKLIKILSFCSRFFHSEVLASSEDGLNPCALLMAMENILLPIYKPSHSHTICMIQTMKCNNLIRKNILCFIRNNAILSITFS